METIVHAPLRFARSVDSRRTDALDVWKFGDHGDPALGHSKVVEKVWSLHREPHRQ